MSIMEIKNIREPNEEEKESIVPKLILFGTTTAVVAAVIYLCNFNYDINQSMYLADTIMSTKTAAQHNFLIKVFETIYGRDYMTNRLEGVSISTLISAVFNACCALAYKYKDNIKKR